MSKIVTIRLSENDYKKIAKTAETEHRTLSNFIATAVLKKVDESYFVDPIEMSQINMDKGLLGKIKKGHRDAKNLRGKNIG